MLKIISLRHGVVKVFLMYLLAEYFETKGGCRAQLDSYNICAQLRAASVNGQNNSVSFVTG